jgi:hypothetical protein
LQQYYSDHENANCYVQYGKCNCHSISPGW